MTAVRFHPEALLELNDAVAYYADRSATVAASFLERIDETIALIASRPAVAPAWPSRPGVRRRLLLRFPYAVVYATVLDDLLVLAIEHTSRRPGYWIARR